MMERKETLTLKNYLENSFASWWIKVLLDEKVENVYEVIETLKEKHGNKVLLTTKDIKHLYKELEEIVKNDPKIKERYIISYYIDGDKFVWINDLHYPELREEFIRRYNEELGNVKDDEEDLYEIWVKLPNEKTYWINLEEFGGFIKDDALGEWDPESEKFDIGNYISAALAGFIDFWIYDMGINIGTEKKLKEWTEKVIELRNKIEEKIKKLIEKEFGIKIEEEEKVKLESGAVMKGRIFLMNEDDPIREMFIGKPEE
jgi:hypothetical protein